MKKQTESPIEFPNAVAYEIFIQSFADSNGDGIGDIAGATQKLDYLQDLGINAIWLMPVMPSPSYHKYDVTDYKAIHPDYGTIDDFKQFVEEAHKRNIKVIIDMIINHTSSEHPWFQQAAADTNSPYREYYVWADKDSIADEIAKKEITQDSDNIRQWHAVDEDEDAEHYYGFFYGGMPDLNFDSEKVRNEIVEIGRFWLDELKVDGFRLDAAKHIFPDERIKDSYEWWQYYRDEMRKIKPDVYLVGEVWAPASVVKEFAKGFPALFNFDLAGSIQQSVMQGKHVAATIDGPTWVNLENENLVDRLIEQRKMLLTVSPDYHDAIFLSNHDQNRVLSNFKGNSDKAKLAASILLTLPGSPYIYYGEEIGMLGKKPDEHIREPFLWESNKQDSLRTEWIKAKFSTHAKVKPLSIQKSDNHSIYHHYKRMIALRNSQPALVKGEIDRLEIENAYLLAFTRSFEGDTLKVIHNLSTGKQKVTLDYVEVVFGEQNLKADGKSVEIMAGKTIVLR
ncbi:alpha-amylase family glycosyl hydrolase [Marivirga aurantiaca]|nr:alpha-amylase family glycosyl hydrolase [Marivirga aurantiaca]